MGLFGFEAGYLQCGDVGEFLCSPAAVAEDSGRHALSAFSANPHRTISWENHAPNPENPPEAAVMESKETMWPANATEPQEDQPEKTK